MADMAPVPDSSKQLIDMLRRSRLFRDYERVFSEATGLALAIGPLEFWQLAHHGKKHENPFCALLAERPSTLAVCLKAHQDDDPPYGLTAAYHHLSLRFEPRPPCRSSSPSAPSATFVSAKCFAICRRSPTRARSAVSSTDAAFGLAVRFAKRGEKSAAPA